MSSIAAPRAAMAAHNAPASSLASSVPASSLASLAAVGQEGAVLRPSTSQPSRPHERSADEAVPVTFQFWNDREFQSYGQEDQRRLVQNFQVLNHRQSEVDIAGGRYVVKELDRIPQSGAMQVAPARDLCMVACLYVSMSAGL